MGDANILIVNIAKYIRKKVGEINMSDKAEPKIEKVGPIDPTKKTSPIVKEEPKEATTKDLTTCLYNGAEFGSGAIICSGGHLLVCTGSGYWLGKGDC